MRLDRGDVAAHAARAGPLSVGVVNGNRRDDDAGPPAILAADPDLDIPVAVLGIEGVAAVRILKEIRGKR